MRHLPLVLVLATCVATERAGAATFTVTNTSDSGAGSLRQAILDANGSPGPDTIAFSIAGAGPHTIAPTSALPAVTETVTIDGTTEPDFLSTPVVEIDGTAAGAGVFGLDVQGSGSVVRSLAINRFNTIGLRLGGSGGHLVAGCHIGCDPSGTIARANTDDGVRVTSSGNTIGGTLAADRNVLSGNADEGLEINGGSATGNLVIGNYIGTTVTGNAALANADDGMKITGANGNTVGGSTASERNVVSGNSQSGILVEGGASSNVISGNYVGVGANGTNAIGNGEDGIQVITGTGNVIGGTIAGERNVVANSTDDGIQLENGAMDNVIIGNHVGVDALGAPAGNGKDGVNVGATSADNRIGRVSPGAANTIAYNVEDGIRIIASAGIGNSIVSNSIHSNTLSAIDIDAIGQTPNDLGDPDTGANDVQNYPVITSAHVAGGSVAVRGTLNSSASGVFLIQAFGTTSPDASGFGEGEILLGGTGVTTDGSGDASFTITGASTLVAGDWVSAIATNADSSSSEMAANVQILAGREIAGTVFDDVNFGGGAGRDLATAAADAPSFTVGRSGADLELYDGAGNLHDTTTSGAGGAYSFTVAAGIYTVRLVNSSVSSARTSSGGELAVQTFRADGDGEPVGTGTDRVGGESPADVDAAANSGSQTLADLQAPVGVYTQSIVTIDVSAADAIGVDFGFNFDTIVNTNDASQGSLRQLIANANTLGDEPSLDQDGLIAGAETSVFQISTGDPGFDGQQFVIAPATPLPNLTGGSTRIDGSTQTTSTGDTNPAVAEVTTGAEILIDHLATINGPILDVLAANVVVASLELARAAGANTTGAGLIFTGAASTGSRISTCTVRDNGGYGIRARNNATNLEVDNCVIRGNGIVNSTNDGVNVSSGADDITIRDNEIVGNNGFGVDIQDQADLVTIRDNVIRNNGLGATVQNAGIGLRGTPGGSGFTITGNTITASDGRGVFVASGWNGATISQNAIHSNGDIGIDLSTLTADPGDGVTANDGLGDADAGGNALQNFPDLDAVVTGGGVTTMIGVLESEASTSYTLEFFSNTVADPSGYGEAEAFIGSAVVVTDGSGRASFTETVAGEVGVGTFVTATATNVASGSTSEINLAVAAQALTVVKRAYREDGTPLTSGDDVPSGARVRFLLYVNNPGDPLSDVSLADLLDPAFTYATGSIRFDNSVACADLDCTPGEETSIYSAALAGTSGTDGLDGDVVGLSGSGVHAGDQSVGNARLDVAGGRAWAMVFTVTIQ